MKPYSLSLVLGGTSSAGCYTAGVLDFLLLALRCRASAIQQGMVAEDKYEIKIRLMAGTSGGAISTALFLAALTHDYPFDSDNPNENNPFYKYWVKEPKAERLLDPLESSEESARASLLNSRMLKEISNAMLATSKTFPVPNFVNEPLEIIVTLSNVRGVKFNVQLAGSNSPHTLSRHEDALWMRYGGKSADSTFPEIPHLDPNANRLDEPTWNQLVEAALASGSLPLALPARKIDRNFGWYNSPAFQLLANLASGSALPPNTDANPFRFFSVDGGTFNNEPLAYAMRVLRHAKIDVSRNNDQAALLLIDPLLDVSEGAHTEAEHLPMTNAALGIIGGLTRNSRFYANHTILDGYPAIFMISPTKHINGRLVAREDVLASASAGAFGGFLHENFRRHDFILGRRNCQQFLKEYFKDSQGRPILPLHGNAIQEIKEADHPRLEGNDTKRTLDAFEENLRKRLSTVLQAFVKNEPDTTKKSWTYYLRPIGTKKFWASLPMIALTPTAKSVGTRRISAWLRKGIESDWIARNLANPANGLPFDDPGFATARAIQLKAGLIDLHLDMLLQRHLKGKLYDLEVKHTKALFGGTKYHNHSDFPRLEEAGWAGACLGIHFIGETLLIPNGSYESESAWKAVQEQLAWWNEYATKPNKNRLKVTRPDDFYQAHAEGKLALAAGVEGAHMLNGKIERVRELAKAGICYLTLVHNRSNRFATTPRTKGVAVRNANQRVSLSSEGEKLVHELYDFGIIPDVAHLNRPGVEKVLEIARSRGVPVVNTHTGCFELNNGKGYERNTKEDHAFEIAQTGGLLGVYVAPMFLGKTPPIVAPSELVAVHIDRLIKTIEKKAKEKGLNLKGVEHVAIGTDYDGAIDIPDDQTDCRDFVKVTYYLLRMGYTEADLERIYRTNFLRAWKTIWNAKTKTP